LNQKVNADIYYKMDKSPLYSAQKYNQYEIIELFENHKNFINKNAHAFGNNVLSNKCLLGFNDLVKNLVSYGSDVNEVDEYGYTPLMKACIKGNMEIC